MKLINSIENLLFIDFLACACDGNYSVLVKEGEPTPEELKSAWLNIITEYYQATDSKQGDSRRDLQAKVETLNSKIFIVYSLIEALSIHYSPEIIAALRDDWGYRLPFTPESYLNDIKTIEIKLRSERARYEIALKEYQKDREDPTKAIDARQLRISYMETLYSIEEHRKMEFDLEKLTTAKFCSLYKRLIDYNNRLKLKYNAK
jgi:hypothetical protein